MQFKLVAGKLDSAVLFDLTHMSGEVVRHSNGSYFAIMHELLQSEPSLFLDFFVAWIRRRVEFIARPVNKHQVQIPEVRDALFS